MLGLLLYVLSVSLSLSLSLSVCLSLSLSLSVCLSLSLSLSLCLYLCLSLSLFDQSVTSSDKCISVLPATDRDKPGPNAYKVPYSIPLKNNFTLGKRFRISKKGKYLCYVLAVRVSKSLTLVRQGQFGNVLTVNRQ